MSENEKHYVTVTGNGTYGALNGRQYQGGPHEIDKETADEMLASNLDWLLVSKGAPITRTENVLRGAFTTADIQAAQQEASRVAGGADHTETAIASKLEAPDASDAADDSDRVDCPHCDKDYATSVSLDRHVATQHPEALNEVGSGPANINDKEGDS